MNNYVPPNQWDRNPYPTPVQFPPLLPQSYNHSYSHNHTHNHSHNYPQQRPYSTPFPLPLPSYASASSSTSEWTRPSTVPSYFPPPLAVTASTAFDPVRSETNGISNERGMEFGLHGRKRMDPHPRVKLEKRRMSRSELIRQVIRTYQSLSSQLPLLPPYLDRKLSSCTPKSNSPTPEMEPHPHPHSHSQSQTPSLPGPELQTLIKLAMEGLELIRCWSELDDRGQRDGYDSMRKEKEGLGRMREAEGMNGMNGMNGMEGMRMDERTGERESSFPPPFQTDSPSTGIPNSNPDRATNHPNPQPPQPSQTPQLKSFLLPAPPSSTPLVQPPTCTLPQGGNLGTVCLGCSTTETPEWRRGPLGPRTLCNACGLVFAKLVRKRAKEASREKEKEKEKEKYSSEHGLQGQTGRGKKISKKRIKGGVID